MDDIDKLASTLRSAYHDYPPEAFPTWDDLGFWAQDKWRRAAKAAMSALVDTPS